jgi:hypothetical protein
VLSRINKKPDLIKVMAKYIIAGTLAIIYGCAKIGSPSGGPKDETPPEIVSSEPVNYSTSFDDKRIEIKFNEFIQLKNIYNELIISPPLEERPVTKLKGKALVIDLNNELRDSTTYTLNFGNAIADNNEGNVLPNFEFVISTGDYVDSMSVTGKLVNAFNLKPPDEQVYIMLYENFNDSAPYLEIPSFIGKTNKDGTFAVNNIKSDTFNIFALQDGNSNLLFDIASEKIAFIDSSFIITPELVITTWYYLADSLISRDSIAGDLKQSGFVIDSLTGDTMHVEEKLKYALNVNMYLFQEESEFQYLTASEREKKGKLFFTFKRPLYDSLYIEPLNFTSAKDWFIKEKSVNNDTVICWITDSLISNMDTISLQLKYTVVDTLKNFTAQIDTVILKYREQKTKTPSDRRSKESDAATDSKEYLKLDLNIKNRATVDLNKSIRIITETPVSEYDSSLIKLYKIEADTLEIIQPFLLTKDSFRLRTFKITPQWEERMNYKLLIEPGAFTDIYGFSNDTVLMSLVTQKADYYGTVIITAENVTSPMIVQLLTEKEELVKEKFISQDNIIAFDFLQPRKYKLKVIYDNNNSRKWDTGNYLKKIQPEKVIYYKGEINVRSNWDVEITWKVD